MKKQTISILKHLGFTEYETRAYLALLTKKRSSASEVAELSGIPQNLVYKTLDGVEHKGGCIIIKGSKKRYEPTDPGTLLMNAQAKLDADVASLNQNIASIEDKLKQVYDNRLAADDDIDYVKLYKYPLTAASKDFELLSSVQTEYLAFSTDRQFEKASVKLDENLFSKQAIKENELMLKLIKERGAVFRVIATSRDLSPILINGLRDYFMDCDGFDMRIVDMVPLKAQIYDTKDIMLSLRNPRDTGYSDVVIHIQDSMLVAELKRSFYYYFEKGISFRKIALDVLLSDKKVVKK